MYDGFRHQNKGGHLLHFFYSHLIYEIAFWGHASATETNKTLVLHKQVLQIILHKELNSSV